LIAVVKTAVPFDRSNRSPVIVRLLKIPVVAESDEKDDEPET
jgi:hypothetical protein